MKPPIPASLLGRARQALTSALDFSKLDIRSLKKERQRVIASTDARNPPITRVLPIARALSLGGEVLVVDEIRIGDLARLQAWLEDRAPHPLAAIPPAWDDPEPETRLDRLAVAWQAAQSWPVRYGTLAGSIHLASTEGRAYFLWLALRRSQPDYGLGDAIGLLARINSREWSALRRVAYGLTPLEEIAEEIAPDPVRGRTANWCLSLHRASQFEGGPGYPEVAEWTLSQWRNFCAEGKAVEFTPEFGLQAKRVEKALEDRRHVARE